MTEIEKELLTQNEVTAMLGINRVTLWRLQKEDIQFPKPIIILSQKKWKKSEIDEYIENKRQS